MRLKGLNLIQTSALFDHDRHLVGLTHFHGYGQDVLEAVQNHGHRLVITSVEEVAERLEHSQLAQAHDLFSGTARGQIGHSPCGLFLRLEVTLKKELSIKTGYTSLKFELS